MPTTKKLGDEVFSGSTCKQGEIKVIVIATGVHTFLGKVADLVDSMNNLAISKRHYNNHNIVKHYKFNSGALVALLIISMIIIVKS